MRILQILTRKLSSLHIRSTAPSLSSPFSYRQLHYPSNPASFGIAFDIDGVLLRGSIPIGGSPRALKRLYDDSGTLKVPYVLLTNGGGIPESKRAKELGRLLDVNILPLQVIQGHTPFKQLMRSLVDTPVASQFKVVKHEEAKIANRSTSKKDGSYSTIPPADGKTGGAKAQRFKFDQLIAATENFKEDYFLGEGGFGKVYKGHLVDTGEIVAIKQLDPNGCQGVREFVVEVQTLSKADHPNLVKLIGCCAEGDQRLLVYEYMSLGSLEDHLFDPWPNQKPLNWDIRMKIAAGAARGLEYLHDRMKPPIIYRDLKCSNILLGEGFHPELSDFGLAKVGPRGDKTHVSTRVMGTYGYCAPDYAMTGQLTFKSDIYSFGVVLLEIITGRRAIDYTKSAPEQNLVSWARPLFKDRKKFYKMADPALDGHYPIRSLYQALAIAAMCVQEQPNMRPPIVDIVTALNYLASLKYDLKSSLLSESHTKKVNSSHKSINDEETW